MPYINIDSTGTLYGLLKEFLEAYEQRTAVMEATSEAAFQARIDALAQDLKTSTDVVEGAINEDKGGQ